MTLAGVPEGGPYKAGPEDEGTELAPGSTEHPAMEASAKRNAARMRRERLICIVLETSKGMADSND